jgi:hypothetical protein
MFRRPEDSPKGTIDGADLKLGVTVAGPGAASTIPGIIVSEIVLALARITAVSRIEVDPDTRVTVGLHRAPSLTAAHDAVAISNVSTYRAPTTGRLRTQAFRRWIGPDVGTAVAYVWPGIDNEWVEEFIQVARAANATAVVVCASLPRSSRTRATALSEIIDQADLVLVGDAPDAKELKARFRSGGPTVETHRALYLGGRGGRSSKQQITAFLAKDDADGLSTLLAAFDAIPAAWIDDYHLQVLMRYSGQALPKLVASSYHANHIRLIGEDVSTVELAEMCSHSSAIIVADPALDSRAFSTAVDCGIATVVLATSVFPAVGQGYVGGLLADFDRAASVHVALSHALRLAELGFPHPRAWDELAARLIGMPPPETAPTRQTEPAISAT